MNIYKSFTVYYDLRVLAMCLRQTFTICSKWTWTNTSNLRRIAYYTPFTLMDIFLTSPYIFPKSVKVHGLLLFEHVYEHFKSIYKSFTSHLRYITSSCNAFPTNIYDLLQVNMDKYEQFMTLYDLFKDCYEYITKNYDLP
jgi:hypothetical protein